MYVPRPAPSMDNLEEVRRWLDEELRNIALSVNETTAVDLRPVNRSPDRPRDGMIVYADGTNWDPGSGEGVYAREGGAWVKL